MSKRGEIALPPGWKGDGTGFGFEHDSGAAVIRDTEKNPTSGIIEWCAIPVKGDPTYTGQDLHSAFAVALEAR